MSTRCVTLVMERYIDGRGIEHTEELFRMYRHCDGYPEVHGEDLCYAVMKAENNFGIDETWVESILLYLIQSKRSFIFENNDTEHGDIEFLYDILCTFDTKQRRNYVTIGMVNVPLDRQYSYDALLESGEMFRGSAQELLDHIESNSKYEY